MWRFAPAASSSSRLSPRRLARSIASVRRIVRICSQRPLRRALRLSCAGGRLVGRPGRSRRQNGPNRGPLRVESVASVGYGDRHLPTEGVSVFDNEPQAIHEGDCACAVEGGTVCTPCAIRMGVNAHMDVLVARDEARDA